MLVLAGALLLLASGGCAAPRPAPSWLSATGSAAPTPPRPPTPTPTASPVASATPSALPAAPAAYRYAFPVVGNSSYARTHHDYPASDIIAPCGAQVRAAADGVVLEVNRVDRWDPATDEGAWRGGRFLSILGDDGVRYYGAHFEEIDASLGPGVRVTAGQSVGRVGTTGKSSACHLHFGISPPCAGVGDWSVRRGVIWPWSYLDSWRDGGASSAVAEVASWQASHGCS